MPVKFIDSGAFANLGHYALIGQNNRNAIVQSKTLAPFHEDITRRQPFEPSAVTPGQYAKIKLDFKHANDREIILNDIRLRFQLDFGAASGTTAKTVGNVFAVRGTDLIRELVIKINEDVVFKVDKATELTHLWLMNNHKLGGEKEGTRDAFLMNYGVIPHGTSPGFFSNVPTDNHWYHQDTKQAADRDLDLATVTQQGLERHDGLPRLIYSDQDSATSPYVMTFDMSLNQLCGPIFHRLHLRRIEFVQIEIMFEPWTSRAQTQNFLLFATDPAATHPYSQAVFKNLEIRQYRTTLLGGIQGFTIPDHQMLSWLMHRYSRREYTCKFNDSSFTGLDIQLHDWEIRSNIVRVWWMLAPLNAAATPSTGNGFAPYAAPCEPYERWGVEILWKNDKVLDLDTVYQVYRHYVLSDNKRFHLGDPYVRFERLLKKDPDTRKTDGDKNYYLWNETTRSTDEIGLENYEMPIYHVDLCMNVHHAVPGTELVGGIVNDTSDYVIRLKKVKRDESSPTFEAFQHSAERTLYVWIEYQTLVNLAGNSSQFNRASQIVTKQLNVQN